MISVSGAIDVIRKNTRALKAVKIPLESASGLVLAEDVIAKVSVPNFNQSAMDGYALRYDELLKSKEFHVSHEVAAGETNNTVIPKHGAVRIFTGAAVPQGLDTVVMQEKVELQGDKIIVLDKELKQGSNVRLAGAEIKKDDIALEKNSFLSPAAVGFLAATGTEKVWAYPKPAVHIIVTGNELVKAGQSLQLGQVYESNSLLLKAAFKQLHMHDVTIGFVSDDPDQTINTLSRSLLAADLILLTGGVSVGNYDFVVKAAEACGVKQLFHKVKQRPGKPLYAGSRDEKIVFGLPGNPASVLSCFYNYVTIAIECMTGQKSLLQKKWLPLSTAFSKKIQLTQFLKALYTDQYVTPLPAQESFRLSSFSIANCLIILPEEKMDFAKGEMVETLVLPYL